MQESQVPLLSQAFELEPRESSEAGLATVDGGELDPKTQGLPLEAPSFLPLRSVEVEIFRVIPPQGSSDLPALPN